MSAPSGSQKSAITPQESVSSLLLSFGGSLRLSSPFDDSSDSSSSSLCLSQPSSSLEPSSVSLPSSPYSMVPRIHLADFFIHLLDHRSPRRPSNRRNSQRSSNVAHNLPSRSPVLARDRSRQVPRVFSSESTGFEGEFALPVSFISFRFASTLELNSLFSLSLTLSAPNQNVFDEAIRSVLSPQPLGGKHGSGRGGKKKKACIIL